MSIINTWQFNVILYNIFVVIFFQCYKLAVKNVKRDGAATIIFQVIAGLSILLLAPLSAFNVPSKTSIFLLLLVACIFYAVNDRLQTSVRKHLEVSTYSIISQLTTVFLLIYGVTLFREPLDPVKLLGAGLILGANILLFYKPNQKFFKMDKYTFMAVCAALAFATAISIDIGISEQFNLPLYISLTLLVPAIFVASSEKIYPKQVLHEFKKGSAKLFILTGIAWGLTIFFSLRALQFGPVNTVVSLEAGAVILNVLAAFIFLKERNNPYKKLIAAAIVVIGVVLTVI